MGVHRSVGVHRSPEVVVRHGDMSSCSDITDVMLVGAGDWGEAQKTRWVLTLRSLTQSAPALRSQHDVSRNKSPVNGR